MELEETLPESRDESTEKQKTFELFSIVTIVLSLYVLGAMLADTFFKLPPEISRLLNYLDNLICIIFLIDFIARFIHAENKLVFMKWGWIDLISSIPTIDYLRPGRALRLLRLLRVLRAFKSTKHIFEHLFKNRSLGTFTSVGVLAISVIIFSSIAILQVENHPTSNIKTAGDAMWWAYTTITTVGYGDKYPVTMEGKIIAAVLMTVGVGLFGTFTGLVSSWFLSEKKK